VRDGTNDRFTHNCSFLELYILLHLQVLQAAGCQQKKEAYSRGNTRHSLAGILFYNLLNVDGYWPD
jgi:hypothetical protein